MKAKAMFVAAGAALLGFAASSLAIDPFTMGSKRDGSRIDKMGIESMRHPKTEAESRLEKRSTAPQRAGQINPTPLEFLSGEGDSFFGIQY